MAAEGGELDRSRRPRAGPCHRLQPRRSGGSRGCNATLEAELVWPQWLRIVSPVTASHSVTVPSLFAVAIRRPSGANATPRHPPPRSNRKVRTSFPVFASSRWMVAHPLVDARDVAAVGENARLT